jgi:hypothetical protein
MTEEELANAAKLMSEAYDRQAESREKFVEAVLRHTDMMTSSMEILRGFEDRIDLRMKMYDAQVDYLKSIQKSLESLVRVIGEAGANWNENNDKLEILMKRLDKHFGSDAGLEYDN